VAEHSLETHTPKALIPGEIALASGRLILTRWVAGVLVLLLTALFVRVLRFPLPEWSLYLNGAIILLYNGLLAWLARRIDAANADLYLQRLRRLVTLQVALDWLAMSAFLHLTGGITSPAIPFFLIHMLMATILLRGRSSMIYVVLGTGALATIALLERMGVLRHFTIIASLPPELYRDPVYILGQVAFFAIAAFATVYLVSVVMRQLRERERQVVALLQSAQAVSSTLSLPEVLTRLAQSAARALSVRRASIRLLDGTGERLPMVAAYGLSETYQNKGEVLLSRSPLDREAMSGHPILVANAVTDPRIQYPKEVMAEGIGSMLVVPIIGRGAPLGVLRVYGDQPGRFTAEDIDFVVAVASQGAVALENALAHETLQKADQARGQFVRTVTHELRAPVSGAQSLLRVLLRGMSGEINKQQREILGRVEARMDSLLQLINDMLALAATKTVELQEPPRPIALQPAVQHEIDLCAQEARDKQIHLVFEAPSVELIVRSTPDGLSQVFGNLIGNAVKYTPLGGRVTVRVTRQGPGAVISISDTGMGIPAEDMPRLWEEFFRASNARRSEISGTGLGLSIVKRLVETYDGLISVQSTEGKGTTFTVTLPLISEPTAA